MCHLQLSPHFTVNKYLFPLFESKNFKLLEVVCSSITNMNILGNSSNIHNTPEVVCKKVE